MDGFSKNPKYKDLKCYGVDLRNMSIENLISQKKINLEWLIFGYQNVDNKEEFFNLFFYNIAGNEILKEQIIQGKTADEIRESWQKDLDDFKEIRQKYLIYEDFK